MAAYGTKEKKEFRRLWWWNFAAFWLHLAIAVTMGAFKASTESEFCLTLTLDYAVYNETSKSVATETVEAIKNASGVGTIIAFSALSATAHLFLITFGSYPTKGSDVPLYYQWIQRQMNPVRWIEYSWSAPLAYMVLLALSGDRQFVHYCLGFVMLWAVMMLGWVQEVVLYLYKFNALEKGSDLEAQALVTASAKKKLKLQVGHTVGRLERYSPTLIAWAMFVVVWCIYFAQIEYAFRGAGGQAPAVAYVAVTLTTILYWSFGFVQLAWLGGWITYYTMELTFIGLSFVAKTQLGLLLFFGLVNAGTRFLPQC